jgi:hypothetical protein
MDIVVWLRSPGLGKYEAIFRENDIDEAILPSLRAEDLKELGVTSFGHTTRHWQSVPCQVSRNEPIPVVAVCRFPRMTAAIGGGVPNHLTRSPVTFASKMVTTENSLGLRALRLPTSAGRRAPVTNPQGLTTSRPSPDRFCRPMRNILTSG